MRPKGSSLVLVKSSPSGIRKRPAFRTDEIIRQSGLYKVRHKKHRLPHEVTLLRDQQFPRCAKCNTAVVFELVQAVADEIESAFAARICLYELPVLEDEEKPAAAS